MKKTVLYFLFVVVLFVNCRTLKNSQQTYEEQEEIELFQEKEIITEEKVVSASVEVSEKKTASIIEKTEFFSPSMEFPQGGVPKVIEREIYLTEQQVFTEAIEIYEKRLFEKEIAIQSLERIIGLQEMQINERDSRLIQRTDWFWLSLAICLGIVLLSIAFYLKNRLF